jgi:hypothetical protein
MRKVGVPKVLIAFLNNRAISLPAGVLSKDIAAIGMREYAL